MFKRVQRNCSPKHPGLGSYISEMIPLYSLLSVVSMIFGFAMGGSRPRFAIQLR